MRLIPMYTWNKGFRNFEHRHESFLQRPWSQGLILLICVGLAMLLANLPFTKVGYKEILETPLSIHLGEYVFPHGMTVEKFINDILMVVFFFAVGLEIKREIRYGELSTPKKALMPVIAAFGGVIAPALIYSFVNIGTEASSGWGIPTATDIAFAVGIMSVLGDRVPISLKVFLTALAIADDLIAILVVAIFYGEHIKIFFLLGAAVLIGIIYMMNRVGEKRSWFYMIPAIGVWILFYYSGIHATMSGVVMAFLIPMTPRFSKEYYYHKRNTFRRQLHDYDAFQEPGGFPNALQRGLLRQLSHTSLNCIGLSYRLEHSLAPWVNFVIMPIFALANAGVTIPSLEYLNVFHFDQVLGSVGMGVFLGLVVGKPLGITLAALIAVKTKIGSMPEGASWRMLFAVACLGGIGFTMSIFVDTLSFADYPEYTEQFQDMGKVSVLMGSITAAVLGTLLVNTFHKLLPHKFETKTE